MTNPKGTLTVTARDQEWTLHLGMSVLADLQEKHGDDVLERLQPPQDAGPNWMPPLRIIIDTLIGALRRHHAADADQYLADDIMAAHPNVFDDLMAAAFPDQKPGKAKRPKRAA